MNARVIKMAAEKIENLGNEELQRNAKIESIRKGIISIFWNTNNKTFENSENNSTHCILYIKNNPLFFAIYDNLGDLKEKAQAALVNNYLKYPNQAEIISHTKDNFSVIGPKVKSISHPIPLVMEILVALNPKPEIQKGGKKTWQSLKRRVMCPDGKERTLYHCTGSKALYTKRVVKSVGQKSTVKYVVFKEKRSSKQG